MRSATGTYALDPAVAGFFRAQNLRLIHRGERAIGKLGRECALRGSFDGHVLHAFWREPERSGWIVLHFDTAFASFEGTYGDGNGPDSSAPIGACSGRLRRASKASNLG